MDGDIDRVCDGFFLLFFIADSPCCECVRVYCKLFRNFFCHAGSQIFSIAFQALYMFQDSFARLN